MTSATLSQATGSSSSPPSTACSASTECGGTGASSSATEPESPRVLAAPAIAPCLDCSRLLFGDDRHLQRHVDVGVQVQVYRVLPHHAQRTRGQAHLAALHLEAVPRTGFRDVPGADRAEELAFGAGLGMDGELEILHRRRPLPRGAEVLARQALELRAPRLEARDIVRGGERSLALRQKEIASETGAHFHAIADVAEIGDLLQENDFHRDSL